ncbi:MAG: hypothetical protein HFJ17_05065 [Clostridia bacterium]|nr:hypothetical protein [Clostridia bacterium]
MEKSKILNIDGAILNEKELEIHLEKVAATYNIKYKSDKETYPIPRLINNYNLIKEVYNLLNQHVKLGISIHPAGEWLLDNFYIIEETVKSIQKQMSLKKYKNFVGIQNGQYAGFARVYVLAAEIVNYTDNKIDADNLKRFLAAYQTKKTLNMDEIWEIGMFLQISIIENIRHICERIYISQIEKYKVESIIERLVDKAEERKFKSFRSKRSFNVLSDMRYPFIEYMSYKLKKYGKKTQVYLEILEEETEKTGTTVSDVIKKEHFDIALRKVSIGNCITSIKKIQRINFLEIFEQINGVEEILKKDPAGVYERMDFKTKDLYRQTIQEISKHTKISEIYIARKILELAQNGRGKKRHIGYYLFGENKNVLYEKLGIKAKKIISEKQKSYYYISIIVILTIIFSSLISSVGMVNKLPIWANIISFILLLIPISEVIIQIAQYVLSKFVKPRIIPKIDFYNGIDKENTTMVVIPTIIKTKEKVQELMKKMEIFYLANKSDNLYFCLLGDCSESKRQVEEYDDQVMEEGKVQCEILNKKYGKQDNPIFHFIYRKRIWNEKEQSYLGWERKRGALTQLTEYLLGNMSKESVICNFNTITLGNVKSGEIPKFTYIITLDSDTDLVLNSAFELVGAMAHILNKPVIENGRVVEGYGLIQPRVGLNIDISYKNLFTKIFAGAGGIDSYTNAISDTYQDNFGEGIFTGKGIFAIEAYSKILKYEIPDNTVLSHDLLEGCFLRCGLASDILLMDGYPTKYVSFMQRLSRWIRGDWQIIKWIKSKKLNILSKFKILDNLRRSLFEIIVIISAIYFLSIEKIYNTNLNWLVYLLGAIVVLPFILEILNLIIVKKEGEQKQKMFIPKIGGLEGAIYRGILTFGCLPYKAYISAKSVCLSLYRMLISHKHLLEWTTSEEAEKNSKTDVLSYYRVMAINLVIGVISLIFGIINGSIVSIFIGLLWCIMPSIMCLISKPTRPKPAIDYLENTQQDYILDIANRTFSFFRDNLTKENNYLIPDNYQEDRKQKYVDRTSSTNIGLSLLAVISGIDLEFISLNQGIDLLEEIINTIEGLEKWNGHLYNWYNIKTKKPLIPRYISTVDSGNFVGYLYVLKSFLIEQQDVIIDDKNLIQRVTDLINATDFSKLYSNKHRLFSIGFNIEEGKLTDSYYDLLASEARQASFIAIAKKDVPVKHWNNLSRTLTKLNRKKGLVSWSGTSFEYLMPNINMPKFEGTLLDESSKFSIMSQMEYAKKLGIPWGISEAAFSTKDLQSNYQYKAFGIPWLGLKRGLADEMVVSSYGSILAINDKPIEVYKNLKVLEEKGMLEKYGFYESIDFTPSRLKKDEKMSIVKTYMAHHQALILLSINNLFRQNIFQRRFLENPEISATSILLQERMPETFIMTKEEKEIPEKLKYQDYENYVETSYNKIDENLIRGNVISNEDYTIAINQKGQGLSKYKDIYINRFKNTNEYDQGIFFYVKNIKTKKIWGNNLQNAIVTFMPDQDKIEQIEENIKTTLKITVGSEEPIEIRRLELENIGNSEETLEISSVFEPVLSKKEQDYSHTAFNNLFLKFDYNDEGKFLEVKRKKRGKDEREIYLVTKLLTDAETIVDNEFEISQEKLNTRGNLGVPTAIQNSTPFSNNVGLVTEPIIAMKKTIKIKPKEKISIDFIISVNEQRDVAIDNLNKYTHSENVTRAFEISKARADAESRYLGIKGKDIVLYQKVLSYIVFDNPLRKKQMKKLQNKVYNQSDLWKYGISGDIPIILVKIKDVNDMYTLKNVLKMYEFFRTKNIQVDILVMDEEKHSYENYVREEIESQILDEHLSYMKNIKGGIFVLSKNEIDKQDMDLFEFISTLVIDSHKGDLEYAIKDMEEEILLNIPRIDNEVFEEENYSEESNIQDDLFEDKENFKYYNEYGAFSNDGKEYLIKVDRNNRLPTVWSHILANDKFGTVITENMGGYTWYKNSRLNRISAWHNRAFADIPSEVIYLQDKQNGKTWSLGLNPMPDDNSYNAVYGFGYAKYIHSSEDVSQELEVFVPNEDSIKIGILKLNNKSLQRKKLKIVYYIKPVLGEDEIKSDRYIKLNFDNTANMVQAQNMYDMENQNVVYVSSSEKIKSFTGNKNFFLGKGGLSNPDGLKKYKLDNDNGIGKKSCIAIEIEVEIDSMSTKEIVLNLGAEENNVDSKNIAYKYSKITNCRQALDDVKRKWKDTLDRIQVDTPLESMNIMLNGWTIYQTISSRIVGKTGFYQSGGAYGFRDQLQDTLSLKYVDPVRIKKQILKHSEHQFIEGDVEHWWHEETGRGIRTRFSDDLVWLVYLLEEYLEVTGDESILDIETNYIQGDLLKDGEDEKYDLYKISNIKEPIYMHCIRAIDKAFNLGERGLPKIGSGDWNDGLSTVGCKGKGESIWLGFFLYLVIKKFIPICEKRGELDRAVDYKAKIEMLKRSLNTNGWDGRWFKRAYTDDGDILGSLENDECRIDSIAQSWSVISGAGDNDKKFISMESLENHLVDTENGIIKLLDPPFENGKLEPGYIKSYLPGVRENGGQYTHAAIWVIIAEAMLGFGDKATELYRMITPIEHSRTKDAAQKYKVEPYVIAADIYGCSNLAGRGGWTWYTGSSSWFYVAGIEYILGMKINNNVMSFNPCIPKEWKEFSIRYKHGESIYNIHFSNPSGKNSGVTEVSLNGEKCENSIQLNGNGGVFNIEVEL